MSIMKLLESAEDDTDGAVDLSSLQNASRDEGKVKRRAFEIKGRGE
jgi:hypothetical protein